MFDYKYLTPKHMKGLKNYKYSAIDTSPLSQYVMHPTWNFIVQFTPNWIAPNLLTFAGFLCLVINISLLSILDYDITSSGKVGGGAEYTIPNWVFTLCGVLLMLAYFLDGIDGKQARKIGVSGPLGEMFDHGLDSYIVFLIPFCLFSVYGRDEYSLPGFRAYLIIASVILNFYVSHWEKYNTGTLYLPWGYDISMWVSSLLFIVAGVYGPDVYKAHVFNMTFMQAFEIAIHSTGLLTTLPVAVYNVYLSYKNRKGKMYTLAEAIRPMCPIMILLTIMTIWASKSPNDIVEYDPRAFNLLFGTVFSNIASRLIVAEISGQRCEMFCGLLWPLLIGVATSLYQPHMESSVLYILTLVSVLAHVHYGTCVARQICKHYKISCFSVPKTERK